MRAVVQRVREATVTVAAGGGPDGTGAPHRASVGRGLCVLLAVEPSDDDRAAQWMAAKIARLRVFPDDGGRMNRSVQDIGGGVLLVSQFTLVGDCRKGNRPSFVGAAPPEQARVLCGRVAELLESEHALPVGTGVFGASMLVEIANDGPVTLVIDVPPPTA